MPAHVVDVEDIRRSHRAALFEGGKVGDVAVSMFITRYELDEGPDLHLHPYPEVFLVEEGEATFTVGEDELKVAAGHVVVVPAETPHGFKNRTGGIVRVVSVHPSPEVKQVNL
jgi:mannose-6-phosphate isomerase-like protein (cupin superfamily)